MIQVIVLDEEELLLESLVNRLDQYDDIEILGKYTKVQEAIKVLEQATPHVVFLDVELGDMNGIEVAEIIKMKSPETEIVFVTSNLNYAVQAFELDALDYLVRPFCKERIMNTIKRIRGNRELINKRTKKRKQVCLFNEIKFVDPYGETLEINWRTKKAEELFAFLLHHHDRSVSKELIVDQLWPCYEWENGVSLLYNSIYHLRRALEKINFNIDIKNENNNYILHLNDVKVDVHYWQERLNALPELNEKTYCTHKEVIYLYKGDYLKSHSYHWSEAERHHNRSIWLYHVRKVTEFLIKYGEYFEAIQLNHHVQEINPLLEESYLTLMKLYHYVDDKDAVQQQYELLQRVLKEELAVEPDHKIKKWYKEWQSKIIN